MPPEGATEEPLAQDRPGNNPRGWGRGGCRRNVPRPTPPTPGFGQLREGGHAPELAHAQTPAGSNRDLEIPRTIEIVAREAAP